MAQWILCGQHSPTRSLINQPHQRNLTVRGEFFINFHQRRDQEGAEISHDINYTRTGEGVDLEDEFSEFLTPPERKTFPRATSDTPRTLHTHVPLDSSYLVIHPWRQKPNVRPPSTPSSPTSREASRSHCLQSNFNFSPRSGNDETCQGWKFIPFSNVANSNVLDFSISFYFGVASELGHLKKFTFCWRCWLELRESSLFFHEWQFHPWHTHRTTPIHPLKFFSIET